MRRPRGLRIGCVEQFVPERLATAALVPALLDTLPPAAHATEEYRAYALLDALGFSEQQHRLPLTSLSGGEQTLALLARALLAEPELLLMDEPGNHMDIVALTKLTRFLTQHRGCPFVLISHDRELLDRCCNRTLFLRDKTVIK